jgi:hypothetical protein
MQSPSLYWAPAWAAWQHWLDSPEWHAGPVTVVARVLRSAAAHRSLGYQCPLARHEGELLLAAVLAAGSEACGLLLIHGTVLQVAGFMSWKLQQLRSEGSENPAQVLSTARNAIRRVRMVMRSLPQLTEEGKRLIGSIQHEATQDTKQVRLRCASSNCTDCSAAATWQTAVGLPATAPHCCCGPR